MEQDVKQREPSEAPKFAIFGGCGDSPTIQRNRNGNRRLRSASSPSVLTVPEVCVMLRCSRQTLYRLLRAEKIPAFKLGKVWRFRKDLIEAWKRDQENERTP